MSVPLQSRRKDESSSNLNGEDDSVLRISTDKGFQFFGGFIPAAILSYCVTPILCLGLLFFPQSDAFQAGILGGIGTTFIGMGALVASVSSTAFMALGGLFIIVGLVAEVYAIMRYRRDTSVVKPASETEVYFHYLASFMATILGTPCGYLLLYVIALKANPTHTITVIPYVFPIFGLFNLIYCTNRASFMGIMGAIGAMYLGASSYNMALLCYAALSTTGGIPPTLLDTPGAMMGVGLGVIIASLLLVKVFVKLV
jgi:hypothetical protein